MKPATRIQLSIMMFLEFFVWGAWFVTLGTYIQSQLNGSGSDIGLAYQTQAIGAMIAPFIIGLIADRYFSAQKIMGVLHLLGAGLMYFAAVSPNFSSFYPHILIYMIMFMPTLALVNSISFRQMKDATKEFSSIRVLGTLGWIVAGLLIGWLNWEGDGQLNNTFLLASIGSGILGIYSFFLPDTPPTQDRSKKRSIREILGLDALTLLKDRAFLVFFVASVLICIPLAFYYNFTNLFLNEAGMEQAAGKMSLGQMSEVVFMLLLPFFMVKLGLKKTILVGMAAWVLRYVLFAFGADDNITWMLITGILLHGICYDFFFVTGQIYTDQKAGEANKSAAQGLITLATYGIGMFIGSYVSGQLVEAYALSDGHSWTDIWLIPAGIATVIMVLFAAFFKEE